VKPYDFAFRDICIAKLDIRILRRGATFTEVQRRAGSVGLRSPQPRALGLIITGQSRLECGLCVGVKWDGTGARGRAFRIL